MLHKKRDLQVGNFKYDHSDFLNISTKKIQWLRLQTSLQNKWRTFEQNSS